MSANAPTNAAGTGGNLALKTSSRFGKESVLDRKREIIWQPDALAAAGPANLLSHGTNNAALAEINSSEICGITLDASTDSHGATWWLPDTIDLDEDIYFRAAWSNSAAAATGSATFVASYLPIVMGTTAVAVGSTALDTVITVTDVDLGANIPDWTDTWQPGIDATGGILDGGTLTTVTPGDDCLIWHVAVTLATIVDATIYAFAVEFGRAYV